MSANIYWWNPAFQAVFRGTRNGTTDHVWNIEYSEQRLEPGQREEERRWVEMASSGSPKFKESFRSFEALRRRIAGS